VYLYRFGENQSIIIPEYPCLTYFTVFVVLRFLNKPAMFFDDVLFSVGKICNHLVSYLTFHKQK